MNRRAMLVDTSLFLARTSWMSTEEIGAAFKLMAYAWSSGGRLTFHEPTLARMMGMQRPRFRRFWAGAAHLFEVIDGFLYCHPDLVQPGRVEDPESRPAIPSAVREAVWQRDGEACRYCGTGEGPFHLDHVMPWSRGGPDTTDNLVVACRPCNLAKKDRTPAEMGWAL